MTWFLVDDTFAFHQKANRAGNQALGLWARAGSWCCGQMTDGKVPHDMIGPLGGRVKDAEQLVRVVLWEPHPDGYVFHEWPKALTREHILAKRESNRVRMNKQRSARGVHAHNAASADVVQVPSPILTDPLSHESYEREPTNAQQRVLRARGARSPAAVWKNATEDERESIRREARALSVVRETCAEHHLETPCRSCAADAKGASA